MGRCFPVSTWGHKAPWLFTHMWILAFGCGALYIPIRSPMLLHVWFTVTSAIVYWGVATTIIAYDATRRELYPYNEERCEAEVMNKFSAVFGIAVAVGSSMVLLVMSSLLMRVAMSAFFVAFILGCSLHATPI